MASNLLSRLRAIAEAWTRCPGAFTPCAAPRCSAWDCGCPSAVDFGQGALLDEAADEIECLRQERDKAHADIRAMVQKAAAKNLDGYRELGARAALAENELDKARNEVKRLQEMHRNALVHIEELRGLCNDRGDRVEERCL